MRFSEPAPQRGGAANFFHSPRDKVGSPRSSSSIGSVGSSRVSPSKQARQRPAGAAICGSKRMAGQGGHTADRRGRGAKRQCLPNAGCHAPETDEEDMPKLVGRPEKWSISQHDLSICQWSGFGWAQCDVCNKWRKPSVSGIDLDVNENDSFVCADMGASACPQGCDTPEDKSWTRMSAFLGESANLDETDTLTNGYIENAVNFLVFKAEDAKIFKGKEGAAQHFINSVGTDPINDVEKLKRLIAQLETKIKENYKRSDEIGEWKASLAQASSAVDVYRQGWMLEELIDWPSALKNKDKARPDGGSTRRPAGGGEQALALAKLSGNDGGHGSDTEGAHLPELAGGGVANQAASSRSRGSSETESADIAHGALTEEGRGDVRGARGPASRGSSSRAAFASLVDTKPGGLSAPGLGHVSDNAERAGVAGGGFEMGDGEVEGGGVSSKREGCRRDLLLLAQAMTGLSKPRGASTGSDSTVEPVGVSTAHEPSFGALPELGLCADLAYHHSGESQPDAAADVGNDAAHSPSAFLNVTATNHPPADPPTLTVRTGGASSNSASSASAAAPVVVGEQKAVQVPALTSASANVYLEGAIPDDKSQEAAAAAAAAAEVSAGTGNAGRRGRILKTISSKDAALNGSYRSLGTGIAGTLPCNVGERAGGGGGGGGGVHSGEVSSAKGVSVKVEGDQGVESSYGSMSGVDVSLQSPPPASVEDKREKLTKDLVTLRKWREDNLIDEDEYRREKFTILALLRE